jgi:hypothetical protein
MQLTHPSRLTAAQDKDPFGTYRDMVQSTFSTEMRAGFFIAYYRNFAIPSIAKTLAHRGETTARPMKRSYDTGIVIHEIIVNGFDSDRGEAMVELLRRVHKGVPGSGEDFLYVLMTLLVIPVRWVQQHGWRKPTTAEVDASLAFYTELGRRMGLGTVPATFEQAAQFLDDYEDRNMAHSAEGAALLNATAEALAVRLPERFRDKAPVVISLMMDKPMVVSALGLTPAQAWLQGAFNAALRVRALITRFTPLSDEPSFTPGKSGSSVYPSGYELHEIGPH